MGLTSWSRDNDRRQFTVAWLCTPHQLQVHQKDRQHSRLARTPRLSCSHSALWNNENASISGKAKSSIIEKLRAGWGTHKGQLCQWTTFYHTLLAQKAGDIGAVVCLFPLLPEPSWFGFPVGKLHDSFAGKFSIRITMLDMLGTQPTISLFLMRPSGDGKSALNRVADECLTSPKEWLEGVLCFKGQALPRQCSILSEFVRLLRRKHQKKKKQEMRSLSS